MLSSSIRNAAAGALVCGFMSSGAIAVEEPTQLETTLAIELVTTDTLGIKASVTPDCPATAADAETAMRKTLEEIGVAVDPREQAYVLTIHVNCIGMPLMTFGGSVVQPLITMATLKLPTQLPAFQMLVGGEPKLSVLPVWVDWRSGVLPDPKLDELDADSLSAVSMLLKRYGKSETEERQFLRLATLNEIDLLLKAQFQKIWTTSRNLRRVGLKNAEE